MWRRSRTIRAPELQSVTGVERTLVSLAPELAHVAQHLPQQALECVWMPVVRRAVAQCWDLPASEAHHHSRPFGLVTHALEVAAHGLDALIRTTLWWAKASDPAERHRAKLPWRVGTAYAGLLHDLGKMFDVTVTLALPQVTSPVTWHPLAEPLLAFLERHQRGHNLPTPTWSWQPGRGMRHEAAGGLAATLLLTREDVAALGVPVARELWGFLGGHPDPANLFRQLISSGGSTEPGLAADRQSVADDRHSVPPGAPTVAARVMAALAHGCRDGTIRVNQWPGHVFVHLSATLVVVPAGIDIVRHQLQQQGVRVPPGTVLYNDLADAGFILGMAGRNVSKVAFQPPGRPEPIALSVLRIPHALLWGAEPPEPFAGVIGLDVAEASNDPVLHKVAPLTGG